MSRARLNLGVPLTLLLGAIVPAVIIWLADLLFSDRRWVHVPFHSVVEALGAFAGLTLAVVLRFLWLNKARSAHYLWTSNALIGMGVLDGFHAAVEPGESFVWLRSTATLVGGFLHAMVWLPERATRTGAVAALPGLILVVTVLFGVLAITTPGMIPLMVEVDGGAFTTTAKAINALGGLFFVGAAARFLSFYWRTGHVDELLFANLLLLFGVAGLLFPFSRIWEADWWWWHLLRLLAYVIVLGDTFQIYRRAEERLRTINLMLERRVAERSAAAEQRSQELADTVNTLEREIAERRWAEEALLKVTRAVEQSANLVVITDRQGQIEYVNPAFARVTGYTFTEVLGKNPRILKSGRTPPEEYRRLWQTITSGQEWRGEFHNRKKDGRLYWASASISPIRNPKGGITHYVAIEEDITELKRAEEALRASEQRYRQLTEGTQDAIVVADQQGCITLFNTAAQQTFGYTEREVVGQPLTLLMPEESRDAHQQGLQRYLETREPRVIGRTVELRGRRKSGETFPLELSLSVLELPEGLAFLGAIRDVTERQQMHARVVQSEKLASLGLLSAGVAHEINNPLAYVANNLAVIERDLQGLITLATVCEKIRPELEANQPGVSAEFLDIAETIDLPYLSENLGPILASTRQGVKRVADIVQNLRGFARLDQATVDRVDLHEAITSSLELIRGRLGRRRIHVDQDLGELPPVVCAPAQVNQVILNLLVNALQAIEATDRGEGRIEIRTRMEGDGVVIEIADDGCGIPAEHLARIFDPFFTTKPVGQGTGLGLAISHGIIQDHGGRIEVQSTPGRGSRFRVILPIEGKGSHDDRTAQALPAGRR
jgi:PAS domain S-box-containing protein